MRLRKKKTGDIFDSEKGLNNGFRLSRRIRNETAE